MRSWMVLRKGYGQHGVYGYFNYPLPVMLLAEVDLGKSGPVLKFPLSASLTVHKGCGAKRRGGILTRPY